MTAAGPGGGRFCFVNRWRKKDEFPHRTRLMVSDLAGRELRDVLDSCLISHFDWWDDDHILAWAEIGGRRGFYLVDVRTGAVEPGGAGLQKADGHTSYSPDRRRILLDAYPRDGYRCLKIYDIAVERETTLGRYYSDPRITKDIRCDLHPKWSRTGGRVCFDSIHEGYRRVYVTTLPAGG